MSGGGSKDYTSFADAGIDKFSHLNVLARFRDLKRGRQHWSGMETTGNSTFDDPWPYIDPPTILPYSFEKIDGLWWRNWMTNYWTVSVLISGVYLLLMVLGQRAMRTRKPFDLRKPLVGWNSMLAIFSLVTFCRTFPELYQVVTGPNGLHRSVCIRDTLNPSTVFWGFLFAWSKILELGDTAFLVLRKKRVIFLHSYHHITVLIFSWATYADYEPVIRWFGVVNSLVHFYMYSYFALMAMRIPLWKSVSITVTIFQLSQMIMGVAVNCYVIWMKQQGIPCARSGRGLNIHLIMYGSYLILFTQYFYDAYLSKSAKKKQV